MKKKLLKKLGYCNLALYYIKKHPNDGFRKN